MSHTLQPSKIEVFTCEEFTDYYSEEQRPEIERKWIGSGEDGHLGVELMQRNNEYA